MASVSAILQLINLAFGDSAYGAFGDWGAVTDENLRILEKTVGDITTKSVTSSNVNLSDEEELSLVISLSGALTGARSVTVSGRKGFWFVKNACTGAFALTFKTDAGTGFVVPQGGSAICYSDGTNIVPLWRSPVITTQVSATGTSVNFTNIPAGVTRITVMLNGVSTDNGVSFVVAHIGDAGGLETTDYNAVFGLFQSGGTSVDDLAPTGADGFYIGTSTGATTRLDGHLTLTRINTAQRWIAHSMVSDNGAPITNMHTGTGNKFTSGEVDRLSVVAVGGGSFDTGTIALMYEFI
jgi:hypothetical protein